MYCVAPECTSNDKSQEHRTPSFAFPSDEEIREKWFRAIPRRREDYEGNIRLWVCLNHFSEEDIVRDIEYFDGVKMIKKPREKLTIKKTAIPNYISQLPQLHDRHHTEAQRTIASQQGRRAVSKGPQNEPT